MAETSHFGTVALHPGAHRGDNGNFESSAVNGGNVYFEDPDPDYPDGNFYSSGYRVNVPQSKILPVLWNMKEWNLSVHFKMVSRIGFDLYGVPETIDASSTIDITGKFVLLQHTFSTFGGTASANLYSTNKKPFEKVSGRLDYYYQNPAETEHDLDLVFLFTGAWATLLGPNASDSSTFQVTDKNGNQSGNASVTVSGTRTFSWDPGSPKSAEGSVNFNITKIYLKEDGTADLFLNLSASAGFMDVLPRNRPATSGEFVQDVTFKFLGVDVPAAVFLYANSYLDPVVTVSEFELTVDLTISEKWTYPSSSESS